MHSPGGGLDRSRVDAHCLSSPVPTVQGKELRLTQADQVPGGGPWANPQGALGYSVSTGSWLCDLEPMASLLSFLVCSQQTHFFKN